MSRAAIVSDPLSNSNEHIEEAAKAIGNSAIRRKVFEAIYHHKKKVKTVSEIVSKTGLSRMKVLQSARYLEQRGIVSKTKHSGQNAYQTFDHFQAHKRKILSLAGNAGALAKHPTKRKAGLVIVKIATVLKSLARVRRVTIDDVENFRKIRAISTRQSLSSSMSEAKFKKGVQSIIGESGVFKDWGGEKSDLYSTRVKIGSKRMAAAFAFKGPGLRSKLVPAKMGKNGDQAQRLFQEPADVFFVQHWREIDSSVVELLQSLAVAASVAHGKLILFGIIDGIDSARLVEAYPAKFK